jgi:hypothetical protein
MKYSSDSTRRLLLLSGGSLSLLGLGACASTNEPVPARAALPAVAPTVRVGDRWNYEQINQYNRLPIGAVSLQVVQAADASNPLRLMRTTDKGSQEEIYTRPWEFVQDAEYDVVQRFAQGLAIVPSDLSPGRSASLSTHYTVPGFSQRFFWSEGVRVLSWQSLKVPAGEFDTALIERRIRFEHSDYARQFNTRVDRLWYAPAVNRWVQREWTGQFLWGGRPRSPGREDWVLSRLVRYQAA